MEIKVLEKDNIWELGYESAKLISLKNVSSILIKPNIVMPVGAKKGVITHPKFVKGVIAYLKDKGIQVVVGEGPGYSNRLRTRLFFEVSGFGVMCRKENVRLINLNLCRSVTRKIDGFVFNIAKPFFEYDLILNVPTMKTHRFTVTSLCLKNLMGFLLPYNKKDYMHTELDKLIKNKEKTGFEKAELEFAKKQLALYKLSKQVNMFNIIDGFYAAEGDGFFKSKGIPMHLSISGVNGLIVDYVTSFIMGFNPEKIFWLKHGIKNEQINLNSFRQHRKKFNWIPMY